MFSGGLRSAKEQLSKLGSSHKDKVKQAQAQSKELANAVKAKVDQKAGTSSPKSPVESKKKEPEKAAAISPKTAKPVQSNKPTESPKSPKSPTGKSKESPKELPEVTISFDGKFERRGQHAAAVLEAAELLLDGGQPEPVRKDQDPRKLGVDGKKKSVESVGKDSNEATNKPAQLSPKQKESGRKSPASPIAQKKEVPQSPTPKPRSSKSNPQQPQQVSPNPKADGQPSPTPAPASELQTIVSEQIKAEVVQKVTTEPITSQPEVAKTMEPKPQAAQPPAETKAVQPQAAQPQAAQLQAAQPQAAQPQAAKPQAAQPQAAQQQAAQPQAAQQQAAQPQAAQPQAAQPQAAQPQAAQPQAAQPQSAQPQAAQPQAAQPQPAQPQAGQPQAAQPQAAQPQAAQPHVAPQPEPTKEAAQVAPVTKTAAPVEQPKTVEQPKAAEPPKAVKKPKKQPSSEEEEEESDSEPVIIKPGGLRLLQQKKPAAEPEPKTAEQPQVVLKEHKQEETTTIERTTETTVTQQNEQQVVKDEVVQEQVTKQDAAQNQVTQQNVAQKQSEQQKELLTGRTKQIVEMAAESTALLLIQDAVETVAARQDTIEIPTQAQQIQVSPAETPAPKSEAVMPGELDHEEQNQPGIPHQLSTVSEEPTVSEDLSLVSDDLERELLGSEIPPETLHQEEQRLKSDDRDATPKAVDQEHGAGGDPSECPYMLGMMNAKKGDQLGPIPPEHLEIMMGVVKAAQEEEAVEQQKNLEQVCPVADGNQPEVPVAVSQESKCPVAQREQPAAAPVEQKSPVVLQAEPAKPAVCPHASKAAEASVAPLPQPTINEPQGVPVRKQKSPSPVKVEDIVAVGRKPQPKKMEANQWAPINDTEHATEAQRPIGLSSPGQLNAQWPPPGQSHLLKGGYQPRRFKMNGPDAWITETTHHVRPVIAGWSKNAPAGTRPQYMTTQPSSDAPVLKPVTVADRVNKDALRNRHSPNNNPVQVTVSSADGGPNVGLTRKDTAHERPTSPNPLSPGQHKFSEYHPQPQGGADYQPHIIPRKADLSPRSQPKFVPSWRRRPADQVPPADGHRSPYDLNLEPEPVAMSQPLQVNTFSPQQQQLHAPTSPRQQQQLSPKVVISEPSAGLSPRQQQEHIYQQQLQMHSSPTSHTVPQIPSPQIRVPSSSHSPAHSPGAGTGGIQYEQPAYFMPEREYYQQARTQHLTRCLEGFPVARQFIQPLWPLRQPHSDIVSASVPIQQYTAYSPRVMAQSAPAQRSGFVCKTNFRDWPPKHPPEYEWDH